MVLGFGAGPARWLVLGMAVTAGARSVLMGPPDRGIDVDLPRDQPGRVRPDLQSGQQFGPGAIPLPAAEESVDRLPWSVLLRQIPPRSPRPHPPPDPIDQPPPTQRRPAQHRNRQQRLQHRPLFVREIPSPHTEIITMRDEGLDRLSKTRPSPGTAAADSPLRPSHGRPDAPDAPDAPECPPIPTAQWRGHRPLGRSPVRNRPGPCRPHVRGAVPRHRVRHPPSHPPTVGRSHWSAATTTTKVWRSPMPFLFQRHNDSPPAAFSTAAIQQIVIHRGQAAETPSNPKSEVLPARPSKDLRHEAPQQRGYVAVLDKDVVRHYQDAHPTKDYS
ncbi:hypothetical protein STENM36S_04939 [Streptomyces tendae]